MEMLVVASIASVILGSLVLVAIVVGREVLSTFERIAENRNDATIAAAESLQAAAAALAEAWKHRTDVEWEILDSPRAARERTPAKDPAREDPRMALLEPWLKENPVPPPSRDNLRGCYAVVVGVREASETRRAECREVVDGYGVPLPDGV